MKKIFAFALLVTFLLSGCGKEVGVIGGADGPTDIVIVPKDDWGVSMYAENVTPTGVKVVCEQSGGFYKGELQTGTPWILEYEKDGNWIPCPTKDGNELVWTMIAQKININSTTEWFMDFSTHYESLSPGRYRVGKVITDFKDSGDHENRTYYSEFIIAPENDYEKEDWGIAFDIIEVSENEIKIEIEQEGGDTVLIEPIAYYWHIDKMTEEGWVTVTSEEIFNSVPIGRKEVWTFNHNNLLDEGRYTIGISVKDVLEEFADTENIYMYGATSGMFKTKVYYAEFTIEAE